MTTNWIAYLCLTFGFLSALVAGIFLAFSDFVMRALLLAKAEGGIESMQHINKTVIRSFFIITFLALAPATSILAIYAWFKLSGSGQSLIITAAVTYLVTVFCVTLLFNIPMNERLAAIPYKSTKAESYWTVYGRIWTLWNHLRTAGSAATAICLLLAMMTFN